MQFKDYYNILGLSPSASPDEIKKAYRQLALQYHPDKHGNNPYASAQFTEIKEAYETLTNPVKKDNYLQLRWYAKSMGIKATPSVMTPVTILKQLLELDKYSNTLDVHRMDKDGLYTYFCFILSDENIQMLNTFKETSVNKEIILAALNTGRLLPYRLGSGLATRLQKIDPPDEAISDKIRYYVRHGKRVDYWEKRSVWLVLLVVLLLCLSIFLVAGN